MGYENCQVTVVKPMKVLRQYTLSTLLVGVTAISIGLALTSYVGLTGVAFTAYLLLPYVLLLRVMR
jgi:hypothetical protein